MTYDTNAVLDSLRSVMCGIRTAAPVIPYSRERAASSDIRIGYLHGAPVRRLVITFRGPGCSWVARGGGCFMCGHHAGTTRGKIPTSAEYIAQFSSEIGRYNLDDIQILSIYNSGSVLNPDEVTPAALEAIFSHVRRIPQIRKVVLETRAEFVDRKRLGALKDLLGPDRILTIALGLETSDDRLRTLCINKGCTLKEITRAVSEVNGYCETQLYVLLGLPFLTEREAVEDCIRSVRCAEGLGADEIHIEPLTLQQHTLIEHLYRAGLYRLPSLHSIYSVLREVLPEIRPYVSPFLHMPLPEKIPSGCPSCTSRLIRGLLEDYNFSRDHASLECAPCVCQNDWAAMMEERDPRPIESRIADALSVLKQKGQS